MNTMKNINKKLYNFGSSLVGNRVFDLYLKYNGIKLLTTSTLVPFALILGKNLFESTLNEQKGGNLKIPDDMPVIDDPVVGSFLKLSGLSALNTITPNTLIPLGVLMLLYNLHEKSNNSNTMTGGAEKNVIINHAKKIWGNRIFDLFTKYQGIKMLSSTTLVPFALILGKDALEKSISNKQIGGKLMIPKKLPIIDDPLLGNYLKITGLSTLGLTSNTLIPLGLAVLLYHLYIE